MQKKRDREREKICKSTRQIKKETNLTYKRATKHIHSLTQNHKYKKFHSK